MATKYLYKDNDNLIKLSGLKNIVTGDWVNSSTNVTARVLTTALVEEVAALPLDYVAASNGNYQATMDQADLAIAGPHFKPLAHGALTFWNALAFRFNPLDFRFLVNPTVVNVSWDIHLAILGKHEWFHLGQLACGAV